MFGFLEKDSARVSCAVFSVTRKSMLEGKKNREDLWDSSGVLRKCLEIFRE